MIQQTDSSSDSNPTRDRDASSAHDYVDHVVEALSSRASELGRAWTRRGATALGAGRADGDGDEAGDSSRAEELVRTLVAAARGGQWHEPVMRAGWTAGTAACWRGTSLYQLLKELDGGVTLLLSAADAATREFAGVAASASDGLALARRIADAASLLRLAAAGGYTRAMSDELRQRYRTIRHDLRNPLGTIASAVALMEDESLPEAMRQNPRVRAMVARNARSMEEMIASTLADSAATLPALPAQTTSLRDLACAVRGDLRAASDGVEVVVGAGLPDVTLDSTGLELLLKAVVLAIARCTDAHTEVTIELEAVGPRAVGIAVFASERTGVSRPVDLAFARDLVMRLGGRVSLQGETRVVVELPVQAARADAGAERPVPREGTIPPRGDASVADQGQDVAREGERPDGESRAF